jgi:PAS domain S-box-containing protein
MSPFRDVSPSWRDLALRSIAVALQADAVAVFLDTGESWTFAPHLPLSAERIGLSRAVDALRLADEQHEAPYWGHEGVGLPDAVAEAGFAGFAVHRFAAGEGVRGALCVLARQARAWLPADRENLERFSLALEEAEAAQVRAWLRELPRHQDARFRTVFETSPLAMMVGDLQGQRFETNPVWNEIFWWFQGHVFDDAVRFSHPDDLKQDQALLAELLGGQRDSYSLEKRFLRPDASILWADMTMALVRDGDEQPHWLFIFVQDITDRKRREADLRHAHKVEALGRLAGGVAHEFNNLMMSIQGSSNLLRMDLPDLPHLRESLEQIDAACARASELTRQLISFTTHQVVRAAPLAFNAAILATTSLLRARLHGSRATLTLRLCEKSPVVLADRAQIEEVLLHLVANAREALPPMGGEIVIETEVTSLADGPSPSGEDSVGCVWLRVRDNGRGIPPEMLPNVFDPFVTTKEVGQGPGLGLSTVYGIVEQASGRLSIESTPSDGTTVSICLPTVEHSEPVA